MVNTQAKRRAGLSAKGLGYLVIAVVIVTGVPLLLLFTGAIWAQIVAGIFIAAIVVPVLLGVVLWVLMRSELANYRAAQDRERESRARLAAEASERRARARSSYIGPNGLPRD